MRIWFNRGYSLAPISAAIMAAEPSIEVYASIGQGLPARPGPIETWVEPEGSTAAYLDWVKNQISCYGIDIFVPTRHRTLIATADLPCKVALPASPPTLALLEDKYSFAEATSVLDCHLPTQLIAGSDALERAITDYAGQVPPCIKPRNGVNGEGFWILTKDGAMRHLRNPDARRIRGDLYISALREQEHEGASHDLVLMEYLPGPEVSFDILCDDGQLLKYAARTKLSNGDQTVQSAHPLERDVASLVAMFGLSGVVNAQFRRHADGSWKILEINARPAGGSVYSESVGCGILADWARLLAGMVTPDNIGQNAVDTHIRFASSIEQVLI
ncbi:MULTISPECIES: ATP-grasp domain-containing protein [Sphingomonadaceae]|jgi:hypothetical protein|uniref:ATP-grasp domain-containing protein n=2 Tax=Sphingomonadaceae TaxID=41297 RepID=A0A9X7YBR1_SPHYA|nr:MULTISPECIES: ATP-grasp domain-containing protein [Sphingomonadaceae]EZP84317.1 carbamoyl phosphate synthase-like protein [Novosphingobium resinovorum]MAM10065.1 ATP-dependent carboxylate-amine ligase [Rhizobiaceae bacterium]PZU69023.1 MAG: ATP-dependent carboxylate-amine ligase [Sphingobium sp.]QNG44634.1 ATP-grasp domain-containing protein [Sphingobium yanoikuyae]|tara:strand:- start:9806 stop:10795 length:990 start_codon:yes stop_codon:yes gene_type:complete